MWAVDGLCGCGGLSGAVAYCYYLQDRRMSINMKTDASTAVAMSMLIRFLCYERPSCLPLFAPRKLARLDIVLFQNRARFITCKLVF